MKRLESGGAWVALCALGASLQWEWEDGDGSVRLAWQDQGGQEEPWRWREEEQSIQGQKVPS